MGGTETAHLSFDRNSTLYSVSRRITIGRWMAGLGAAAMLLMLLLQRIADSPPAEMRTVSESAVPTKPATLLSKRPPDSDASNPVSAASGTPAALADEREADFARAMHTALQSQEELNDQREIFEL